MWLIYPSIWCLICSMCCITTNIMYLYEWKCTFWGKGEKNNGKKYKYLLHCGTVWLLGLGYELYLLFWSTNIRFWHIDELCNIMKLHVCTFLTIWNVIRVEYGGFSHGNMYPSLVDLFMIRWIQWRGRGGVYLICYLVPSLIWIYVKRHNCDNWQS